MSGRCATKGYWSDAAAGQNQALIAVLTDLKNKDPCKPFMDSLVSAQNLAGQISGLTQDQSFRSLRQAEETLQELTLELKNATTPEGQSALASSVYMAQVDLANKRAENTVSDEFSTTDRYLKGTSQLSTLSQGLLQQAGGMTECFRQNPAASMQVVSSLMGIGGSFAPPVYGAAMMLMAQLISISVEAARQYPLNKAIWDLHSAKIPLALTCGLESLTDLYCQANDSFELLQFQAERYPGENLPPESIWAGLDILGRRLPILTSWLQNVRTGVVPSDPTEAQRQIYIWTKYNRLDTENLKVMGNLNYAKQLYETSALQPDTQKNVLIQLVGAVSKALSGWNVPHESGNPFVDFSSSPFQYSCWLVRGMGTTAQDCPTPVVGQPFDDYLAKLIPNSTAVTMEQLFKNWTDIFLQVRAIVDIEFSRTITVDPLRLLSLAFQSRENNVSPFGALVIIKKFLIDFQARNPEGNPQSLPLIEQTLEMANKAMVLLSSTETRGTGSDPLEKIQTLFNVFRLQKGVTIFVDRVRDLVRFDIHNRINELPPDVAAILQSSSIDIREHLLAAGVYNLDLLNLDLNQGRSLTEQNIKVFREFFEADFGKSIDLLYQASIDKKEPPRGADRPNGQSLAELCILLMSTGQWPKKASWDKCSTALLSSVYPDPENKLNIEVGKLPEKLKDKRYSEQVCTFYRFLRAGRLMESLRKPRSFFGMVMDTFDPKLIFPWID